MDPTTLAELERALAATPTNAALRAVIVRGWIAQGDVERARAAATERLESLDVAVRVELGKALSLATRFDDALPIVRGETPELLREQARALAGLRRLSEARDAYDRAIEERPEVADAALAEALVSPATSAPGGGRRGPSHLRVVSNDDTDAESVHRLLHPHATPITFADVGGLDDVKEEVRRRIVAPFADPALFARFKKRVGGGVLLYGPPGCGKTLIARATAGECKARFLSIAISDVLDMYIGESERKLRAIFDDARSRTPTVVFFDELEALAGKRKNSRDGVAAKVVSQFLAEMDGFAQNNRGVLVLGATNVPWEIDAAFRRPGRFDRVLFVPPPDREARRTILEIHLKDRPVADVRADKIAEVTGGFSGADLEGIVETAADHAIRDTLAAGKDVPISRAHVDRALKEVKPTTIEWLSTARNHARYANEGGQYDDVLAFLGKHAK